MKEDEQHWEFRLYVAGHTRRAKTALHNLTHYCEKHLQGRYAIEVIDLLAKPELAAVDQILAIPTLVRISPQPVCKIIGDLSSEEKVLTKLHIRSTTH